MATEIERNEAYFELENFLGNLEAQYNLSLDDLIGMCDLVLGDGDEVIIEDDHDCGPKDIRKEVIQYPLNLSMYDFIPFDELTTPKENSRVLVNRYWQTYQGKALIYVNHNIRAPQCNAKRRVVEKFLPHSCDVTFIELAFLPEK
ncbi:MAG: hypothetical protein JRE40_00285 [Deltaproteobacteria bacterium]|nr:hypothetical protein [Deltaproteobacteria bacterium]